MHGAKTHMANDTHDTLSSGHLRYVPLVNVQATASPKDCLQALSRKPNLPKRGRGSSEVGHAPTPLPLCNAQMWEWSDSHLAPQKSCSTPHFCSAPVPLV